MAFFPKEEVVRRRGVAMRIKEPHVKVGIHRDVLVEEAAKHFEEGEFVLNRVMDGSPPPVTKVKTFHEAQAFRGNGNILAPKSEKLPPPVPKVHRPLEDSELRRLHPEYAERQRRFEQDVYENAPGFYEGFSPQPGQRLHKVMIEPVRHGHPDIFGFKGLGQSSVERVQGKGHVAPQEYNPLRLRATPFHPGPDRPRGLMRVEAPVKDSIAPVFHYDDGVKLEDIMKREIRHPHIKQFQPTPLGMSSDIPGFNGLGMSDTPQKVHGRRSMYGNVSHDPLPSPDKKPSPTRRDTSFSTHFPNYSNLPPPPGGFFHPNYAHSGIISPPRAASSFR